MSRSRAAPAERPDAAATAAWQHAALVATLALVACVAGFANEFTSDDRPLIVNNLRVWGVGSLGEIFSSPYWPPPFDAELYRPLTTLLHAVLYTMGGGEPLVFRIVSYVLYAGGAVAVLLMARRFLAPTAALVCALLFAAHPVHVEAVAAAVGQGELVIGILAIASTMGYVRWRREGPLAVRHWTLLAACYVVASLFKETGLVLPGLWLCAELLVPGERPSVRARQVAAGFGMLGVIAVALLALRWMVLDDVTGTVAAPALMDAAIASRALTMLTVVPHWARLLVWPSHLSADYSPQVINPVRRVRCA